MDTNLSVADRVLADLKLMAVLPECVREAAEKAGPDAVRAFLLDYRESVVAEPV